MLLWLFIHVLYSTYAILLPFNAFVEPPAPTMIRTIALDPSFANYTLLEPCLVINDKLAN